MEVLITDSAEEAAEVGADHVCEMIAAKPSVVLGLATGSTPVALYQRLISRYQDGRVSFANTTSFNLDEYVGLDEDHPQSYRQFMNHQLFDHVDIDKRRTHVPRGAFEPAQEARHYEALITAAGGIDLQVLGLGRNGHIGYNEPGSSLRSRTRVKTLTQETIEDNKRFFDGGELQPTLAITVGIGTILDARKLLLLATGEGKASAVKKMVEGPLSANCPASVMQLHEKATIIVDRAASSLLTSRDYYRRVRHEAERLAADSR